MLKGESDAGAVTDVVNDEEPEAPAKKTGATVETEAESGSGQPSDDLESSGANLAEGNGGRFKEKPMMFRLSSFKRERCCIYMYDEQNHESITN